MAVAFALSPAMAIPGIIDFTSRMGKDVFRFSTEKLDEELYDCHPDGMIQFLQSLSVRALEYGWDNEINGILQIPEDWADVMSETNNLIESYGMITMESVRAFEASYIALQIRPAQDTYMLYKCLMNSISKEGKSKITIWKDQYHVNGFPSGNLLLKVIVRESHLDTNATISTIRTKLSNLDTYMLSIGGDITKFNTYVKGLVESLNARGETTTDLLINLFKGYLAVEDKSFNLYVLRKQEEYDEGGTQTEDSLMSLAKNKFTLLKDAGRYNMPSAEEEKILALQAELKQVSKRWNKEKKGNKSGETEPNKKKVDWKDRNADTKKKAEKPGWMSVKPKEENLFASPRVGIIRIGTGAVPRPAESATGTGAFTSPQNVRASRTSLAAVSIMPTTTKRPARRNSSWPMQSQRSRMDQRRTPNRVASPTDIARVGVPDYGLGVQEYGRGILR
jgi:hypothetical protein